MMRVTLAEPGVYWDVGGMSTHGWLLEANAPSHAAELPRRYYVAVPIQAEAIATLRRRLPGMAGASIEPVTPLTRHAYSRLRMKRGDIVEATLPE